MADAVDGRAAVDISASVVLTLSKDFVVSKIGQIGRRPRLCSSVSMAREHEETKDRLLCLDQRQESQQKQWLSEHDAE